MPAVHIANLVVCLVIGSLWKYSRVMDLGTEKLWGKNVHFMAFQVRMCIVVVVLLPSTSKEHCMGRR